MGKPKMRQFCRHEKSKGKKVNFYNYTSLAIPDKTIFFSGSFGAALNESACGFRGKSALFLLTPSPRPFLPSHKHCAAMKMKMQIYTKQSKIFHKKIVLLSASNNINKRNVPPQSTLAPLTANCIPAHRCPS